jgi:hypothetical protein
MTKAGAPRPKVRTSTAKIRASEAKTGTFPVKVRISMAEVPTGKTIYGPCLTAAAALGI